MNLWSRFKSRPWAWALLVLVVAGIALYYKPLSGAHVFAGPDSLAPAAIGTGLEALEQETGERPQVVYPAHFQVRPVRHNGDIRFASGRRFVSEALAGWPVGIESLEQGRIRVWFADLCLGETDASFRSPLRPPRGSKNEQ